MVERWTNAETFASVEVPQFEGARFVVDNNRASDGSHGGGIKIERPMVMLPCVHHWGNGG